jgi:glycine/D-amino acid oxidase-like deaminating enzyme/nitrite reductase/ring-hydroxylating ferredoxin subunit
MNQQNGRQPLWDISHRPSFKKLTHDMDADVIVIGGGITGLTAGILLKKMGKKVILLEADRVGSGTTGATSAHLSALWDVGYDWIHKKYGHQAVHDLAVLMSDAIDDIEARVREYGIECDFCRIPGYYYSETEDKLKKIEDVYEAIKDILPASKLVEKKPLSFAKSPCLRLESQARFQPQAYLEGLAEAFDGDDCYIFEKSPVIDYTSGDMCSAKTKDARVKADQIIMATHLPLGFNPLQTVLAPYRSYIRAFKAAESLEDALFWDTDDPYHYIRSFYHNDEQIYIVGGCDRKTGHGHENQSYHELKQYIDQRFSVKEVIAEWSSQFYLPADGLPFIGRTPLSNNVFVATGFSGDGLTMGTAAAKTISNMINGTKTVATSLFSPARLHASGIPKFVKENIDAAKNFIGDRILSGKDFDPAKLSPGEGKVVAGFKPVAYYKNENGNISKLNASCPHLKCVVHWNESEKTFDCPCHGSRFDTDGKVLTGPAMSSLSFLGDEKEQKVRGSQKKDSSQSQPSSLI